MSHKKKKREFNDLLIPIILIIAILPFVTRLITYDAGLSDYSWYSDYDVVYDFFSYYKSYVFIIIAIISAIVIFLYFLLQRNKIKNMKSFIPIGIYSICALLSTIFSINSHSSTVGGTAHFEGIFVLLGYVVMLIYTYQIDKKEEDYRSIFKAFIISCILMCIIGFFQLIGKDLLFNTSIQKIIIPNEFWKDYIGNIKTHLRTNAISLTLFNPNYASVYLSMIIPFLIAMILPCGQKVEGKPTSDIGAKKENIICIFIIIIFSILLYKTYSRAGLVSVFVSLLVLGYFNRKYLLKRWKESCFIIVLSVLVLIGIDYSNDFRYIEKIAGTAQSFFDDKSENTLEEIMTNHEDISIKYGGELIFVALSEAVADGNKMLLFKNETGEDITDYYDSKTSKLSWNQFEDIEFYINETDDKSYILCNIKDILWRFYYDQTDGYVYLNDYGKADILKEIEHLDFGSLEDIGSGRGYIWSRTLPLLKDNLIIGKGPDTFLYAYPQSDYVGKANNCKTPYTLIEKPHNLYFMIGIQTGMISLIAFITFYFMYLVKSIRLYKGKNLNTLKARMGLGCLVATLSFMISGLFNDSSLQTTPIFIVLLGLGMDINHKLERKQAK